MEQEQIIRMFSEIYDMLLHMGKIRSVTWKEFSEGYSYYHSIDIDDQIYTPCDINEFHVYLKDEALTFEWEDYGKTWWFVFNKPQTEE